MSLRGLLEEGHEILGVTPEGGRGHYWHDSLMEECKEQGVTCFDFGDPNSRSAITLYKKFSPEIILSVLYTEILSEEVTQLAPCAINFHPSLLPSYRGTAPLIWAIVNGETRTGVSAHRMEKKVDSGEILGRREFPIGIDETGFELHNKAAIEISKLVIDVTRLAERGRLSPIEPLNSEGSFFSSKTPRINKLDPMVQPVRKVMDIVRALAPPLPCAWFAVRGKKIVVESVQKVEGNQELEEVVGSNGPGFYLIDEMWHIVALDGILKVTEFPVQLNE